MTRTRKIKKKSRNFRKGIFDTLCYIAIVVILAFFLFPLVWEGLTSIKPPPLVKSPVPKLFFTPSLENWEYLIERNFWHSFKNSFIISFSSSLVTLLVAALAAYALTFAQFKGRRGLALDILSLRMLPPAAVIIPIFLVMKSYHLYNTYLGMILIYTTFNLPFSCWLMIGYFKGIPVEIGEAARVDGCSWASVFWKIALPLSLPGLVTVFIFCVLFSWSEFLFALILTGEETQTLPVAAAGVLTHYFTRWGGLAVIAVFVAFVPIVLTLSVQRNLVRGISLGAIK